MFGFYTANESSRHKGLFTSSFCRMCGLFRECGLHRPAVSVFTEEQSKAVWTLAEVAVATCGKLSPEIGAEDILFNAISTDSRNLKGGMLFVALCGDRFDGHDFVASALETGAAAVMVSDASVVPEGAPAVIVSDTLLGLQELAAWHRKRQTARVVGLTGSAGKTTTKELVAAILAEIGPTHSTRGNLNNHIGVPLTMLSLNEKHRFSVVEMGCNNFGEIARLAQIAAPTAGLITNVGEAHLEGLGDLDGVARAKGELFAALPPSGVAVVNLDDERVRSIPSPAEKRIGYGSGKDAHVRLLKRKLLDDGRQELHLALPGHGQIVVQLGLLGEHNARNALAAAALAFVAGASVEAIEAGLSKAVAAPGRLELKSGPQGLRVIDDSYNANPRAMMAALDLLVEYRQKGTKVHALLGEMLELGADSPALHERIGNYAASKGVDTVIAVQPVAGSICRGALEAGLSPSCFHSAENPETGAAIIGELASAKDVVLVKGSRGVHMERAVEVLCSKAGERGS